MFLCNRSRGLFLPLLLWLLSLSSNSYGFTVFEQTIEAKQWPAHAHLSALSQLPQVNAILQRFVAHPKISIRIAYAASGRQRAQRLHDALIAMGIPSSYLEIYLGSTQGQLVLSLYDRR